MKIEKRNHLHIWDRIIGILEEVVGYLIFHLVFVFYFLLYFNFVLHICGSNISFWNLHGLPMEISIFPICPGWLWFENDFRRINSGKTWFWQQIKLIFLSIKVLRKFIYDSSTNRDLWKAEKKRVEITNFVLEFAFRTTSWRCDP